MQAGLADISEANLIRTENELKTAGAAVVAAERDVSKRKDVELMGRGALDAFGQLHLLFNIAVGAGGTRRNVTWNDWDGRLA
jgi:hypothetical protein